MKTISHRKDLPAGDHYVVLIEESMKYDDGYGSVGSPSYSTHTSLSYNVFMSEKELKDWIIKNDDSTYKKQYSVYHVSPCVISKQVSVDVKVAH